MQAMTESLRRAGVPVEGTDLPEIEACEVLSMDEGMVDATAGADPAAGTESPHEGRS
jgi:hypothetical protein